MTSTLRHGIFNDDLKFTDYRIITSFAAPSFPTGWWGKFPPQSNATFFIEVWN